MSRTFDADDKSAGTTRRRFLRGSAAVAGGTVLGAGASVAAGADNLPPNIPEWMKAPGEPTGGQPYGVPSPFEKGVVKNISKTLKQYISASSRTPLQELDGIITPNGLFYERHHGGVPTIDPAQHRLLLHGLVERPLIFTMDDLRRFPSESRVHFLECSGNPGYSKPYGRTASDLVGLVSCAEWTGVSLKLVLQEAGLKPDAKWVVAEGADAAALTRSIPIEKCLEDAMLVYSQNGERLRPQRPRRARGARCQHGMVFRRGVHGGQRPDRIRDVPVARQHQRQRDDGDRDVPARLGPGRDVRLHAGAQSAPDCLGG